MNKIILGLCYIRDITLNLLNREPVVLISEPAAWSIYEDCVNIRTNLKDTIPIRIAYTPFGLRNRVVHFASVGTLVKETGLRYVHRSNRIVLTWFHIAEQNDHRLAHMKEVNERVERVHTSCTITANQLIQYGLHKEKITIIPIGVDTEIFHLAKEGEREQIRKELDIPGGRVIVGSFQKDGSGWGEGMEPKAVKGPDIFCDVIDKVSKNHPVHVLLTGPSRGYVKRRLEDSGVPYTHVQLDRADDVARYYRALDIYLVASRAEGGPKAIFEAAASGIPLVTTNVGMVSDTMEDGVDCLVAPIEDVHALAQDMDGLMSDPERRNQISHAALVTSKRFDIRNTVRQYYDTIYKQLLQI